MFVCDMNYLQLLLLDCQGWKIEDDKQNAILNVLQESKIFHGTFIKAKPGEGLPDIRMTDQTNIEVKLDGGAGNASVQNKVSNLNCGLQLEHMC